MNINFQSTQDADLALLPPKRASDGAAGYDLCANLKHELTLAPNTIALVPTGLMIELPEQIEAQIRPRSGLAVKSAITVVNSPGTIDWDYRGEIKVALINLGQDPFVISHGMRIAQMVFARVELPIFTSTKLQDSKRGENGFGSTGVR